MAAISGRSGPCDAGDGGFGVKERGELSAFGGRFSEFVRRPVLIAVRPAGQRDARPFHPECACVGFSIGGIVQHREHMVEEVFDIRP